MGTVEVVEAAEAPRGRVVVAAADTGAARSGEAPVVTGAGVMARGARGPSRTAAAAVGAPCRWACLSCTSSKAPSSWGTTAAAATTTAPSPTATTTAPSPTATTTASSTSLSALLATLAPFLPVSGTGGSNVLDNRHSSRGAGSSESGKLRGGTPRKKTGGGHCVSGRGNGEEVTLDLPESGLKEIDSKLSGVLLEKHVTSNSEAVKEACD
ncbi:unnamed protein product [Closterium sp. NIES-53]